MAVHPGDELGDVGELREADLAAHDQVGAADVEIVAAAALEIAQGRGRLKMVRLVRRIRLSLREW